jgi:hypothetical protein
MDLLLPAGAGGAPPADAAGGPPSSAAAQDGDGALESTACTEPERRLIVWDAT